MPSPGAYEIFQEGRTPAEIEAMEELRKMATKPNYHSGARAYVPGESPPPPSNERIPGTASAYIQAIIAGPGEPH
jgi:hypothetical protein